MIMLCNPEDNVQCSEHHEPQEVCAKCQIALCRTCRSYLEIARKTDENIIHQRAVANEVSEMPKPLPYCIPMALANDNMFGYTSSLLVKYKVRWIEMAAVLPIWTSMIVYYVEGDYGHLMNETTHRPRWRTAVHGHCFSFIMPWETICKDLAHKLKAKDFAFLPHDEECLSYMLSVHLKVAGRDFHEHLRQVHLRPFVLVLLLWDLIQRGYQIYDESREPGTLRKFVEEAVEARYPEQEAHIAPEDRIGYIPPRILSKLQEQEKPKEHGSIATSLRKMVTFEKHAVPDQISQPMSSALEEIRPSSFMLDRVAESATDPASIKEGALRRYGDLHIGTSNKFVEQWNSRYTSLAMPFVVTREVSGRAACYA